MTPRPTAAVEGLEEYVVTSQDVWRLADPSQKLKLDWNESPRVHEIVRERLYSFLSKPGALNWYPDVAALDLSKAIASFLGLSPFQVLPFGGSDVALETVARVYLSTGDTAVVVHPGYDNFRVYAESCGAKILRIGGGQNPFHFSTEEFEKNLSQIAVPKILYLINPNNPVGYLLEKDGIRRLLKTFPSTAVLVDEAYIEFAGEEASLSNLIAEFDNLFVFRSFSKAFGIAGLRLGYVVSDHRNLTQVRKLRNGKNLTMFAQLAGLTLLENMDVVRRHVSQVNAGKQFFIESYRKLGGTIVDGVANFALIRVSKPEEVIIRLKTEGIYVRDRSQIAGLEGTVRITFGYREHMERVLDAFRQMPPNVWKIKDA